MYISLKLIRLFKKMSDNWFYHFQHNLELKRTYFIVKIASQGSKSPTKCKEHIITFDDSTHLSNHSWSNVCGVVSHYFQSENVRLLHQKAEKAIFFETSYKFINSSYAQHTIVSQHCRSAPCWRPISFYYLRKLWGFSCNSTSKDLDLCVIWTDCVFF